MGRGIELGDILNIHNKYDLNNIVNVSIASLIWISVAKNVSDSFSESVQMNQYYQYIQIQTDSMTHLHLKMTLHGIKKIKNSVL